MTNFNQLITSVEKRHDFMLLFDVRDGNPNGDPDAGNLPRIDPETMHGLVTDVCLKRKIRDYVIRSKELVPPYNIYVQHKSILLNAHEEAYTALGKDKSKKPSPSDIEETRKWMCENYYDIRMFGAVMTLSINCGQVRGPVQLTFARSINPIIPLDVSITRVAVTKKEDAIKIEGDEETQGKVGEMGRKSLLPYGLYLSYGFFNPALAKQTGVTSEDLKLFWEALINMFEMDRSAARGLMSTKGLYVFTHESSLGNAPAYKLFELVKINLKDDITAPRKFEDYIINIPDNNELKNIYPNVTLTNVLA